MDYIDLDLVDGVGDALFVRCHADGFISFGWYVPTNREREHRKWDRRWWDTHITGELIPIIATAFKTLKENNNGPVHPCPAP